MYYSVFIKLNSQNNITDMSLNLFLGNENLLFYWNQLLVRWTKIFKILLVNCDFLTIFINKGGGFILNNLYLC